MNNIEPDPENDDLSDYWLKMLNNYTIIRFLYSFTKNLIFIKPNYVANEFVFIN
jgi:hypothetical protein